MSILNANLGSNLVKCAAEVLKERQEAAVETGMSNSASYLEGVSDGLAFLLAGLFPSNGSPQDVKELLDELTDPNVVNGQRKS